MPHELHGIQVNVPRQAIAVTDAHLHDFNDQRRLYHDPTFARLIRPVLLGWPAISTVSPSHQHDPPGPVDLAAEHADPLSAGQAPRAPTPPKPAGCKYAATSALTSPTPASPRSIADALHVPRSTLYAALPPDTDGVAAESAGSVCNAPR